MHANIAVVGVGEIGTRHLQALVEHDVDATIYVIDSDPETLQRARSRFEAALRQNTAEVIYANSARELGCDLDLAVIATASLGRMAAMRSLLNSIQVKYLVSEKVLFPSLREYDEAMELLDRLKVTAWVNCPRRIMSFYNQVQIEIAGSGPFMMRTTGTYWDLACNGIHYIDLCAKMAGTFKYRLDTGGLWPTTKPAKRRDYVEFYGTIRGVFDTGDRFDLTCGDDGLRQVTDVIETESVRIVHTGGQDNATLTRLSTGDKSTLPCILERQSQLTHIVAEQICTSGACGLTVFSESVELHLPFVRELLTFYSKITGITQDSLPIT